MKTVEEGLDQEWLQLISTAKTIGLTIEEVRHFFANCRKEETLPDRTTYLPPDKQAL